MTDLRYEVLVVEGVERQRELKMPDGSPIISSPCASTLIIGESGAVLVDPAFTHDQIQQVGDWVEHSGKQLVAIYATHGHGDHWFGTAALIGRFPGAVAYATAGTIALMHANNDRRAQWDSDFPGLIPDTPVTYQQVPPEGFELEGHMLVPVEVGHSDTDDTTVLHVPSIGLVVGGDVVYNGVHQMLLETPNGGFDSWLAALDTVAALEPRHIVAGHKDARLPDDPAIIEQTREYLLFTRSLIEQKVTPMEFFETVVARYPDRLNTAPAWYGALALLS